LPAAFCWWAKKIIIIIIHIFVYGRNFRGAVARECDSESEKREEREKVWELYRVNDKKGYWPVSQQGDKYLTR